MSRLLTFLFVIAFYVFSLDCSFGQSPSERGLKSIERLSELDTTIQSLKKIVAKQALDINKVDASLAELLWKSDQVVKVAEMDVRHSSNLISITGIFLAFIGTILAIFSFIGIREIKKITSIRNLLTEELKSSRKNQLKAHEDLQALKDASVKEGKELLQILFYLSEGDRDQEADKLDEAINWYKQALKIRQDDPQVYAKLGHTYSRIGKYAHAISCLEDGKDASPDNLTILTSLARAYRKSGQYEKAEVIYKDALSVDKNYIWALSGQAQVKIKLKKYHEAEDLLSRIMQKEDSYHAYLNLGLVYLGMENEKEANSHFTKSLKIIDERISQSQEYDWLFARKCIGLIGLKRYPEALKLLKKLTKNGVYAEILKSIEERLDFFKELRSSGEIDSFEQILKRNNERQATK